MKKLFFVILMTIVSAFVLTPAAMAIDNGIFCWNLAPFPDNIEVAVVNQGSHYGVYGVLRNPVAGVPGIFPNNPGPYSIAIDGAATPDPIHGDLDFEFTWSELTDPLPGGPTAGFFSGKLLPGLAGPYTIFDVISGVLNGGGLAPIPCPIP